MKHLFILSMSLAALAPTAFAASGKTADGCSYQVVNGQYLTNCGKSKAADQVAAVAAAPAQEAAATPTNYATVPMRYEPSAPHPVVLQSSLEEDSPRTTTKIRSLDREEDWKEARDHHHQDLLDSTYVGAMIGASTLTSASAGSALGVGVNVGTNIDDYFGFQLGYSYSSQDLNLHLDSRGSADPMAYSSSPYAQANDATLRAHLITGEVQAHLTDTYKRLRPYLGAGLGWKSSSVEENSLGNSYGNAVSGGALGQNSLGGLGSAGLKFRVAKALNLDASFRYFFPILRQDSKLEQPGGNFSGYGVYPTATRLTKADDALTGSGQYQIVGGLQYLF